MEYIIDKFLEISLKPIPYSNPNPLLKPGDTISLEEDVKIIPKNPSITVFIPQVRVFSVQEVQGNRISIKI